ncbi:UvrD-helicase domain-containing protein [Roseomonas sp. NAR14]|uniref:DNA 3'-5' helicase n=1 Tax=Roseomonas acroporae TaxID=2937791 RepID=A0A9X1Y6I0_9PROT|nr:UvrD-helicase domain-containing protein [Roseomonas acroporae]MCK8783983.1 UvrD-helicase domain-containing protein [Roseomonas acroporae]
MPLAPGGAEAPDYLARLNPEQRAAVETLDGPLLVLAGAGTGKTRVLTTRFAHLLMTGRAYPGQVLAVTFTNKAAREMRERVGAILERPAEGLWLGTFHALCARMLRRHAEYVGLKSNFTILDADDQMRLLKQVMEAAGIDLKRWPAQGMMAQIQKWKDRGLTPARVTPAEDTDFANGRALAIYGDYQSRLRDLNAADFGDLLLHMTEILRTEESVLAQYHRMFRYILVDEYQDTNLVQYLWLRLLAQGHRNICCVGDDDQCLAAGTRIAMADGTERPIEQVRPGDRVLSCYGAGSFRPAPVTAVFERRVNRRLVRLRTAAGRELVSTPEHVHFADLMLGDSPQRFFTYLMHKQGVGYRLGTSQVYTAGQARPMLGFKQRCLQEHADALWLVDAFAAENDARECEHLLSLRYGVSTLPFVARKGGSENGLVHDQARLDRIHAAAGEDGAGRLMTAYGLDPDHPHHRPQTFSGRRRNLIVTLYAEHRGPTPMHRVALSGNDAAGREAVLAAGLNTRAYRRNPANWRYESLFRDMAQVESIRARLSERLDVTLVRKANLLGKALTLRPAAQIRPGMVLAAADGSHDPVVAVESVEEPVTVHDIDVAGTHNFVANGLVTHNSIYSWRGAEIENILRFEKDFPGARIVRLESNYRSTRPILAAASGLIAHNTGRLGKTLRPGRNDADGEKVKLVSLWDSEEEARMVGERIEAFQRSGHRLAEIAILVRAGFQTRAFEERLITLGVPYRVVGGLKFYERAEIRDAMAYMRVLAQPADDLAFERIVNVPKRGLGDSALRALHEVARHEEIPLAAAAGRMGQSAALRPKPRQALAQLDRDFARWREMLPKEGHVATVATMLDESGYTEMWKQDKSPEAPGRLENLKELLRAIGEFETLAGFLEHVALVMENDENAEGDRLSLMTLHAAKGLEFDTVFLPGWEEGLFPHQRALDEGGTKGLEEERRLAYVGITRARRTAIISFAANRRVYANWSAAIPSRFIDELPPEHVEREGSAAMQRNRMVEAPSVFTSPYGLTARKPKVIDAWEVTERPAQPGGLKAGERVFHQKFGYGTVLSVDDNRLEVAFEKAGRKRVLDSFVEKA